MTEKTVLYVEDEETDVLLLQLALQKARIANPLKIAADGDQAVAYLRGDSSYADREQHPIPGLVLLDLNLPRLSGLKVLQWIREQAQFADLPVIIYTSSSQPRDQVKAMQLGANEYIVKPSQIEKIAAIIKKLKERWLVG